MAGGEKRKGGNDAWREMRKKKGSDALEGEKRGVREKRAECDALP